jgi:hypothetical protein
MHSIAGTAYLALAVTYICKKFMKLATVWHRPVLLRGQVRQDQRHDFGSTGRSTSASGSGKPDL